MWVEVGGWVGREGVAGGGVVDGREEGRRGDGEGGGGLSVEQTRHGRTVNAAHWVTSPGRLRHPTLR